MLVKLALRGVCCDMVEVVVSSGDQAQIQVFAFDVVFGAAIVVNDHSSRPGDDRFGRAVASAWRTMSIGTETREHTTYYEKFADHCS